MIGDGFFGVLSFCRNEYVVPLLVLKGNRFHSFALFPFCRNLAMDWWFGVDRN